MEKKLLNEVYNEYVRSIGVDEWVDEWKEELGELTTEQLITEWKALSNLKTTKCGLDNECHALRHSNKYPAVSAVFSMDSVCREPFCRIINENN